jgi:heavy metal sensor kinase
MIRWWKSRTLRFRLAVWYAVVGTTLLAGFSATLYYFVFNRMARPLDHQLRVDLEEVTRHLTVSDTNELLWDGQPLGNRPPWMRGEGAEYPWFEIWDERGILVRRLWGFAVNRVTQTPSAPVPGRETISIFNVASDIRLRVLSLQLPATTGRSQWMIRMIRIHQPAADALNALRWIIFIALPIVIALLVVGGYWITRRWLLPLDHMTAQANRITAADLSRRLPVANPNDELGQLASVFNVTLDRLESSFDALDRFVADASHELRTPLTTLRSVGEVGLRRGRSVEEYREIIGSMLEETQRLELLVQRLLELASAESSSTAMQRTPVALEECVTACVSELGILAEHKGQNLKIEATPCRVATDPVIFRQALQNLVDNAIKYSPGNSTIRIAVSNRANQVEVAVTDQGPGIHPDSRAHLMERFYRPDRSRDRDRGGYGLGLSITKAYMRALGGSLEYEAGDPSGSTFRLILPI